MPEPKEWHAVISSCPFSNRVLVVCLVLAAIPSVLERCLSYPHYLRCRGFASFPHCFVLGHLTLNGELTSAKYTIVFVFDNISDSERLEKLVYISRKSGYPLRLEMNQWNQDSH